MQRAVKMACRGIHVLLLAAQASAAQVVINEFLARPADNDAHDWVELFNPSGTSVDLTGWHLTDDAGELDKWTFPASTIGAGGYLIVFASNSDTSIVSGALHANFALKGDGEYLGLVLPDGSTIVQEFAPEYPPQEEDVSYGILADRVTLGFFTTPTPGALNASGFEGVVAAPVPSVPSGCFTQTFFLAATSTTPSTVIRYETSGVLPTESSPVFPEGGLEINSTVQLRVQAFAPGHIPSAVATWTYFLLAADLYAFSSDLPLVVVDTLGASDITASDPKQVGYIAVFEPGADARTRFTSAASIVTRAGLRRRGESTLRNIAAKPNLGVEFWQDDVNVDRSLSPLGLPSESDWILHAPYEFDRALVRNSFVFRTTRAMGEYASRDRFVEVFLNYGTGRQLSYSDYVGVYILVERIKRDDDRVDIAEMTPADNTEPAVSGGYIFRRDKDDPGFISFVAGGVGLQYVEPDGLVLTSQQIAWLNSYLNAFKASLDSANFRDPILGYAPYIDRPNWLNNHIINLFSENVDWSTYSTYFHKDRSGPIRQGPVWDSDRSINSGDGRDTNPERWLAADGGGNTALFTTYWWGRLFQDPDFWQAWIDRWDELRRDDGPLSNTTMVGLLNTMSNQLAEAQVRNFAKWGTPPRGGWTGEMNVVRDWVLRRGAWIDAQFIDRPEFNQHGGWITPGFQLTLSTPANSTVFYTLDGTDPRSLGGAVAPSAEICTGPITLSATAIVRTRAWDGTMWTSTPTSRPWSPINTAIFAVANPTLAVSEVMFHPRAAGAGEPVLDRTEFEFVEIRNTGTAATSLLGVQLSGGVEFDFTYGAIRDLAPGSYALAVGNAAAFSARYPAAAARVAGTFSGNLNDGGDECILFGPMGDTLSSFTYDDARGWPQAADGAGHSLVPLSADGLSYGGNWRASACIDGSPGVADPAPVQNVLLNELGAHTDYVNPLHPEYDSNDWLELFNTRTNAISLANWYLSDDPQVLRKWAIPPTHTIPASGWITFDEVTGFHSPITTGFGINKAGESVYLSYLPGTSADRVADVIRFKGQENGATLGRYPDGGAYWQTTVPTRGTTNALAGDHVVINQLMVHPADGTNEYVVLYNPSETPAALWNETGTYRMDGGISYRFPPDTMIAARDYLTLVPFSPTNATALAAFETAYGLPPGQTYLLGPYDGKLDNGGERVALERPQAPDVEGDSLSWVIVDEVIYSGYAPWPTNIHANGNALQRISVQDSGNDPLSWVDQPAGLIPARIFVIYPRSGNTLYMPFSVEVLATIDPNQVSGTVHRIDFFLDDAPLGTVTNSPYRVPMTYSHVYVTGTHRVRADLVDDSGTNRSVDITFYAQNADRVHIVEPPDATRRVSPFTQLIRVTVDAEHILGSVSNVSFYTGTNLLHTDATAPYEFLASQSNLPPTRWHELTATVLDDFGPTTSRVVRLYSYDSVWSNRTHRMAIHFPGYQGEDPLQAFPVAVTFTEGLPGFSYAQALPTGADLRFADWTGTNTLYHEIENWDTNGASAVWVLLPELVSTSTWIWAYWGDPAATLPGYATDGTVWTNDYSVVLHLSAASGAPALDSSPQALAATFAGYGTWSWGHSGAIGKAARFIDLWTYLSLGPGVSLGAEWTISGWFKNLDGPAYRRTFGETTVYNSPVAIPAASSALGAYIDPNKNYASGYSLSPTPDAWHQVTAVGDAAGTRYFIDGEPVGAITNRLSGTLKSVGNRSTGAAVNRFAQYVDEFRISRVSRGAEWIAATWMNRASNGTFVSFGPAELQHPSSEPVADSDGDGMLDAWEEAHLGGTAADPDEDPDRDGMLNIEEFIAGTNPTNALSLFDMSVEWSNGQLYVVFSTVDPSAYGESYRRYYSLESTTNLLAADWRGVGGYTNIPAFGQPVSYTNPPGPTRGAFRGQVWLTE